MSKRERERWIERIRYRVSQEFKQYSIERTSNIHGLLYRNRKRSVACLSLDAVIWHVVWNTRNLGKNKSYQIQVCLSACMFACLQGVDLEPSILEPSILLLLI